MKKGRRRTVNQAHGRTPSRIRSRTRTIMELPDIILMDILSRLPVKTILVCRYVCTNWRNIIMQDPHFPKLHFSRAPLQFLLRPDQTNFSLAEFDEQSCITNCDKDFFVGRKFLNKGFNLCNKSEINSSETVVLLNSSCNGLICLQVLNESLDVDEIWKPFHVYNPITTEHVVVTQVKIEDCSEPFGGLLGFSKRTNEVKLLRFVVHNQMMNTTVAHIQTLGTNTWRDIGLVPWELAFPQCCDPFLNGALHWLTTGDEIMLIVSLDFQEEKFQLFQLPSSLYDTDDNGELSFLYDGMDDDGEASLHMDLGSLKGCLCLCFRPPWSSHLDVWVMNEYGIEESWTKQFVINDIIHATMYEPIKVMDNGEILILCDNCYLISYNPRRGSLRNIRFSRSCCRNYSIGPHIASFFRVLRQGGN